MGMVYHTAYSAPVDKHIKKKKNSDDVYLAGLFFGRSQGRVRRGCSIYIIYLALVLDDF